MAGGKTKELKHVFSCCCHHALMAMCFPAPPRDTIDTIDTINNAFISFFQYFFRARTFSSLTTIHENTHALA